MSRWFRSGWSILWSGLILVAIATGSGALWLRERSRASSWERHVKPIAPTSSAWRGSGSFSSRSAGPMMEKCSCCLESVIWLEAIVKRP